MAIIANTIPNLVSGVSQQPDSLRFSSQCDEQVNMYSSVVDGLIKRAPRNHIAKAINGSAGALAMHTINRDANEQYAVIIRNGSIKVFTKAGVEKTVATPDGVGYLATSSPATDIRATTIADYTFITNRSIATAMTASTSAAITNQALIWIRQGANAVTYRATINGTTYSFLSVNADANAIATGLGAAISTGLGAGWTVTVFEYVVKVLKNDNADFTISATTSSGVGTYISAIKDSVQAFVDLPAIGFNGFKVKVAGTPTDSADDYYVSFAVDGGGASGKGLWNETIGHGQIYQLDASKMPHVLVRETSGDFTFKRATWANKEVGDASSNPNPSFIGYAIQNTILFKGRLCLLSDENQIYSSASDFFNFFRTTVTSLLDGDPIDVQTSSNKVAIQFSGAQFNNRLVTFSESTQFVVDGQSILTPRTINVTESSGYSFSRSADAFAQGNNIYYSFKRGTSAGIAEYFLNPNIEKFDSFDVTGHCPSYITGDVIKIDGCEAEKVIACMSTGLTNGLYVYKYFYNNDQRLQSAWFKATVNGTLSGFGFINSDIILAVQYSDGLYLESINTQTSLKDDSSDYTIMLDRRVKDTSSGVSVTYDAATDRTTFTVPYVINTSTDSLVAVSRFTNPQVGISGGLQLQKHSQSASTIVVNGNFSTQPVWLGITYTSYIDLSKPVIRTQATGSNSQIAAIGGNYILHNAKLQLGPTKYIRAEVTPLYNDTYKYTFTNQYVSTGGLTLGADNIGDGELDFPVHSRNTEVTIRLANDTPYPSSLLAIEYEGNFNQRSRNR